MVQERAAAEVPHVEVDGIAIASLSREGVVDHIAAALAHDRGGWVITVNADHMQRCSRDPQVRAHCERAELVVADGAPVLWAAKLKGTPLPDRVAGSDLVWLLAERAQRDGHSLYLLGGEPGAAELAARELTRRWPALRIAGWSSPRVSLQPTPDEIAALASTLCELAPDLVYVALGAPKQENVIAALRERLPGTWWLGVGISLSFISHQIPRAPLWMQQIGLEWLHRLAQEPRRLAGRYLLDDLPYVVGLLARSLRTRRAELR